MFMSLATLIQSVTACLADINIWMGNLMKGGGGVKKKEGWGNVHSDNNDQLNLAEQKTQVWE